MNESPDRPLTEDEKWDKLIAVLLDMTAALKLMVESNELLRKTLEEREE